jgi:hypothetical protein
VDECQPLPARTAALYILVMEKAHAQGLTLVYFSAQRERFCGIRLVVSWSIDEKDGSGSAEKWTSESPSPAHASHLGIRSAGMTYPLVILLVGPGKLHRPLVIENHFEFSFLVSN